MDYVFKDPLPLARVVRFALFAWLVLSVCYGAASAYNIFVIGDFQRGSATRDDLTTLDQISQAVAIPMVVVNLLTIVLVARWIYRANKNAHALSGGMDMTPGWNVGWFFIPFANLWKPLEGIRQAWRASVAPADPYGAEVPGWLTLWWIGWITSSILNNVSFRLSLHIESLEQFVTVKWIETLCTPVDLLTGSLLLVLVTRLSRIQHDADDVEAKQAVFE